MSAEVASGQASTRATAPGVAHGATLDSPSLFETTARVTAVSFGVRSARRHARQQKARARFLVARASTRDDGVRAIARHARPVAFAPRRDRARRALFPAKRVGRPLRPACVRDRAVHALPLLRVDVAAPAPPRERVARSADDVSQMIQVEREDLLPESTILSMLTPVARADPACSF